jgi:WD40 repeat protein
MSNLNDFGVDEQSAAREIKKRMRGLDPFIPTPPPYEIVRPESRLAAAGGASARVYSRLRPNFGAPAALIAIAFVVVLVVMSGNFRTAPIVGPSASLSPVPSRSAAPSATDTAVVVPTPTLPIATASPPPGVIFSGPVQEVAWSPGNTRIAVTEAANGGTPDVRILTAAGTAIETVNAWSLGWLDEDTYVGLDYGSGAFVGRVGSSARQVIPGDYVPVIPASTAGAVALELNETASNQYVIWTAAGLSAPRDGVPVGFSPDGSLLAVVHYPRACCAGLPSPEPSKAPGPTTLDIVRTDTGKSVRSTGDIVFAYGLGVSFSPDGRMVAFRRDTADGHEDLAILDIGTGRVWVVQSGGLSILPQQTLAWLDSTHLDLRAGGEYGREPAGFNLVVTHWPWNVAARSVSSRGAAATAWTDSPQIDIQNGGKMTTRTLPGTFAGVQLLWSPDGSSLLVTCHSYDRSVPDQVVLLRP